MKNRHLIMLNLGCGNRTHEAWVNIDYSLKAILKSLFFIRPFLSTPNPANYINHDLRHGIPFSDSTVDVVYACHVLEHLEHKDALPFMKEIHRVLKPYGLVRIVVPDLEKTVLTYIDALDTLRSDTNKSKNNQDGYQWATIMLLDQLVRTQPGGEMAKWLQENRHSKFVRSMEGNLLEIANANYFKTKQGRIRKQIIQLLRPKCPAKSGELHKWMYDDVSLEQLLAQAGFKDAQRMSHSESRIPEWTSFLLDSNPDSSPHQPGSIWFEAIK